jgi:hypothetical protein
VTLASTLVAVARREIGTHEDGTSNCGLRVNAYKRATTLADQADENWPWCAAFICWVVYEAMRAAGVKETETFHRPKTAAAFGLIGWSLDQDKTTQTRRTLKPESIQAGDLLVFKFSHCGIATGPVDPDGMIPTIEGNTSPGDGGSQRDGGGVHPRKRRLSQVKARIRFTV